MALRQRASVCSSRRRGAGAPLSHGPAPPSPVSSAHLAKTLGQTSAKYILRPKHPIARGVPAVAGASEAKPSAEPAAAAAEWAPLNGRTAVIVGAGPAGCTLAMYLARAGWLVQVYERRPEPGPASSSRQRSWVLAMYPRGIRPVTAVAEVPLLRERAYKGLVIKPAKPGDKPLVLERNGVLMDRTLLATSLLDAARRQYGSRVGFTFNASLERVEFDRKAAVFRTAKSGSERELVGAATAGATAAVAESSGGVHGGARTGSSSAAAAAGVACTLEVPYDLLVGSDGSNSTLRSLLAEAFPEQYDTELLGSPSGPGPSCYKSVYGLPALPEVAAWDPDSGAPPEERLQGEFFFFLSGGTQGFMSMCRDIDGTYCGYLAAKESTFTQLSGREAYLAMLPQAGPQLRAEWLPLLADKLMEAPLSSFPVMRSLSRFWSPGGVVLVGDAAHTVTPALGQGLNSALQDCELLAGELAAATDAGSEAVDAALRRFSESRAPEVRALQELELMQGSALAPLSWGSSDPIALATLLARKWVLLHYSGMALLGTVAATIQGARSREQQQQVQGAGAAQGSGGGRGAESVVEARSMADVLATQMNATYVRSPPMSELLRGHMGYREMLVRVYGMAALGTGCTAALLYGIGSAVAAAAVATRALSG